MDKLIQELEQLCPSCKFVVMQDEVLGNIIRITEYGRPFVVRLDKEGFTAEEWFRHEIDRMKDEPVRELEPDEKYRVICPSCGPVVIGYGGYHDQMNQPDRLWFCPSCGNNAMFDDEAYEKFDKSES